MTGEVSPRATATKARALESLCSAPREAAARSRSSAMNSNPGSWQCHLRQPLLSQEEQVGVE